jgi:hypothetical protein
VEEKEKEEVTLKPARRIEKPVEGKEDIVLKPVPKKEAPAEEKEEINLKPIRRTEKPEEEKEEINLKPIPKKQKSQEEKDVIDLKPVPRKEKMDEETGEVKLKQVPKKEKPKEGKEEINLKPIQRKGKPKEEKDGVKLKPVPQKEKPEEEKEEIRLKPVPQKEKPEEEKEDVRLKPVPQRDKPEEEKEEVRLKPIPRKEKPEKDKEDISLKPVPKKEKPKETEDVQLKLGRTEKGRKEPKKKEVEVELVSEKQPEPVQIKEKPRTEEAFPEKSDLPWLRKKPEEPQPQPNSDVGQPELPQTVPVASETKDVEVHEEKAVAPWRRRKVTKPKETIPLPVSGESKPEELEELQSKVALQLPELKPIKVEDKTEDFTEEQKSETRVTLSTIQKHVAVRPKPESPSEEVKETEEVHQIWQKEMKVDTVSKKKIKQHGRTSVPEDDRPLRELEIVTAKRVTEGVVCLPEEPVVEDVQVREDEHAVRRSLVQETATEITTKSSKIVAPYFIQRLQPVIAKPNKTALFTCKVDGYPFPQLTWYRNGVEIQPTSSTVFKVFESTATLEISNVTADDVGNYTCQASNPAGVATSTANLVVIGMCHCVACSCVS